jgi:hypothetical protein
MDRSGRVAILVTMLLSRPRPYRRLCPVSATAYVILVFHPAWIVDDYGDCGLARFIAGVLAAVIVAELCLLSRWRESSRDPQIVT